MIGIANDSWLAVIGVCFIWSLVFCVYVYVLDTRRKTATISHFESTDRKPKWGKNLGSENLGSENYIAKITKQGGVGRH